MVTQLHIHVHILFSHIIMLHHKWLDIVPRATQQDLIANPFQREQFVSTNPKLLNHHTPLPLATTSLFSKCMSSFRWKGSFGLYMRLLIWVMSYGSRPSLSDFLHSGWEGLVPPMLLQMALGCSVLWRRSIPLCVYTASSLALNCYFPDTILFSTVQRGDPVTHTCRHSMFSHYHAPSNMTRQCTQRYTAGSHC